MAVRLYYFFGLASYLGLCYNDSTGQPILIQRSAVLALWEEDKVYEKILVPLDGSQRAEAILRHVEELALRFEAKVIFVQVVEPAPLVAAAESAYMHLRQGDYERRAREAQAYLAAQQGKFRGIGIEAESRVLFGPVVEAIIKAVRSLKQKAKKNEEE